MSAGKPSIDNTDKASSIVSTTSTAVDSTQTRSSADDAVVTPEALALFNTGTEIVQLPPLAEDAPPTFFGTLSRVSLLYFLTHVTRFTSSQSYADVPTEGGVDTIAFIEASEGVLALFGTFPWAPIASVVQSQIK